MNPLNRAVLAIVSCYHNDGLVLTVGNGGSACDAAHLAAELGKGFEGSWDAKDEAARDAGLQEGIRAVCIPEQVAACTAAANDIGHTSMFAQPVYALGRDGDVLVAISTSGNSPNVVNAAWTAAAVRKMTVIALTGKGDSQLRSYADIVLAGDGDTTAEIQESHIRIYHALVRGVQRMLQGLR